MRPVSGNGTFILTYEDILKETDLSNLIEPTNVRVVGSYAKVGNESIGFSGDPAIVETSNLIEITGNVDYFSESSYFGVWSRTDVVSCFFEDGWLKQTTGNGYNDKITIALNESLIPTDENPVILTYDAYLTGQAGQNHYQGSIGFTDSVTNYLSRIAWLPVGGGNYGWYVGDEWKYRGRN